MGNVDRGEVHTWNVAFERRLPFDTSVDVAYVGAKGRGGYAALDVNAPQTLGVGDAGRPFASLGRLVAINSWGQRLKTDYNSLQIALNKPFTHGLLFKGAYTLSKSMNESDNDGRATLSYNTPSELYRNWAPAGFDRRHNFQLGFRLRAPVAERRVVLQRLAAVIQDWQVNGVFAAFSGTPFTVTASGTALNTPNNPQTADLVGTAQHPRQHRRGGPLVRPGSFTQPTGVRFGNTGRNQFYGPGALQPRSLGVPHVPDGRRAEARVPGRGRQRAEPCGLRQPAGQLTSGTYGQITGINGNYPERMVRLGLRFTF